MKKLGEIQMPEVTSAQLAKLDPSIPYLIMLKEGTPDRVTTELIAFLGKCNVMATVLVGNPKDLRIFASFPWSVAPQLIRPDIHALTLEPPSQIAEILRKNFISSIHDDAEAVEVLYQRIRANGINDPMNQTALEAMVRCSIMRFQVLDELFRISDPLRRPAPTTTKRLTEAAPEVTTYDVSAVLEVLVEFSPDELKEQHKTSDTMLALAASIAKTGVNDAIQDDLLKLQNKNVLMSGVLTALRAVAPEIKATKTRRTTTKSAVKRTPSKKK